MSEPVCRIETTCVPAPIGGVMSTTSNDQVSELTGIKSKTLDKSISKAQEYLLESQYTQGYWQGDLKSNPSIEAEHLLLTEFLGIQDEQEWEKIVNYLRGEQLPTGGWGNYNGSEGDLSTTVECYFALKLTGLAPDQSVMQQAREFIQARGGIPDTRVFTKIWLALFGVWDWGLVPQVPPEIIFLPNWLPFNIYDFASWARGTIVPLTIVISEQPIHELPVEKQVPELFPDDWDRTTPEFTLQDSRFSWEHFFLLIDKALRVYSRLPWQPGRSAAQQACVEWIIDHQEADGSWGGIQPPWVYSLIALDVMGYDRDHPVMKKGIEGLQQYAVETEDEWWLQASVSPVWDTAWAVIALIESGVDTDHSALQAARDWLLDREVRYAADWTENADLPETGGWPFEFVNQHYPDTDDTAEVIIALDKLRSSSDRETTAAIDRGLQWLIGLQSSDGGWGAYDVDNNMEVAYEIPFADFGAMIDPPSVDVTAHCLEVLARFEFDLDCSLVQHALSYIKERQQADGSWFGRWGVNYVYGPGTVLPALEAIDEDMNQSYIRDAVEWLINAQNPDGGWGETPRSYDSPELAGEGPSTPSQTAWALLGLIAGGATGHPSTQRGIAYLIETQSDEGSWPSSYHTGTGFPGDFYLIYGLYSQYFPLLALSRYQSKSRL